MNKNLVRCLTAAVVVMCAAMGYAQEARRLSLLQGASFQVSAPDIQKELGITEEQKSKIEKLLAEYGNKQETIEQKRKSEGHDTSEVALQILEKSTADELLALLTKTQSDRLKQVALQQVGPLGIAYPEVWKELGLTSDQRSKIAAIGKKYLQDEEEFSAKLGEKLMAIPVPAVDTAAARSEYENLKNGVFEGMKEEQKALEAEKKKAQADILATLTAEQAKAWKTMLGKPFPSA